MQSLIKIGPIIKKKLFPKVRRCLNQETRNVANFTTVSYSVTRFYSRKVLHKSSFNNKRIFRKLERFSKSL